MDFFNNLQDFLAGLSQTESLYLALLGVSIFILAFILGVLLRGRTVNQYKKQLLLSEKERTDYEARYIAAQTKEKALAQEVEQLSREKVAALEALETARMELANAVNQTVSVTDPTLDAQLASLQEDVELLEKENALLRSQLAAQPETGGETITTPAPINKGTQQAVAAAPYEGPTQEQIQAYLDAAEDRFTAFEMRLSEMDHENARLEAELAILKNNQGGMASDGGSFTQPHQPILGEAATDEDGEPLVIRADITDPGVRTNETGGTEVIVDARSNLHAPVLPPEQSPPDDLQAIKNIGPFIEKKLNQVGIFGYAQISAWTEKDIENYTQQIGYVPGLIQKDNWVGQAKELMGEYPVATAKPTAAATKPHPKATKTAAKATKAGGKSKKSTTSKGKTSKKQSNLKVIEGIGPKIEEVLKAGGIKDLSTLSTTSQKQLKDLLAAAGSRYQMHKPDTWPVQAELAKNEQWTELKMLQDKLKGGVT